MHKRKLDMSVLDHQKTFYFTEKSLKTENRNAVEKKDKQTLPFENFQNQS